MRSLRRLAGLGLSLALLACVPELPDTTFVITEPRVLAVASLPAEATPPASVSYVALYADRPSDSQSPGILSWDFCTARLALTDEGTVSPGCVATDSSALSPVGTGDRVEATLPADGCRLFGPDAPTPENGQPAARPVDPDPTGGYYQPVRLAVTNTGHAQPTLAIGATRLACGLAGASAEVSTEYQQEYRPNTNPAITALLLVQSSRTTVLAPTAKPGVRVPRGTAVTLRATWSTCPMASLCGDGVCDIRETPTSCATDCTTPRGCTGSEEYVAFNSQSGGLDTRREGIQIAWYVSGGRLANATSGRGAAEAGSSGLNALCPPGTECIDNTWTTPSTGGEVLLWVVIRDDRGGVGWGHYRADVE